MHAAISSLLRKDLRALSEIVPSAAAILPVFDQPDVFDRFLAKLGNGIIDLIKGDAPQKAFMRIFASRNSGAIILQTLLASGEDDDTFPPSRPVPASIAALARRFDTSRSHVLRMFREAEESGLMIRDVEAGTVTIHPELGEELLDFFAVYFIALAACSHYALASESASAA
jgi:AraC-like DNA-binding protein